ncbi:MAG: hypothetical protein EVJ48_06440 [Candidatus Acidulodesulfobacterium acidiphilum]|uniref:YfhO family protein n=1 Tax=Candidatus Acidulodesulfobacterium acidiphilum TaxID=2597224 RepID=A0A520XC56_9DELT|nr:MAG: hypothetical protein EVJ48_06440 [Candidatus Acidulodesulfobacterium acidiphilum]
MFNKNSKFFYSISSLIPYFLFLVVLFFKFKGLIINGKILYYGDIETYFMPTKIFIARSITGGKIPLWSQSLFIGDPFFADPQNGTYYFLNILLDYLIPNHLIINYSFLISFLLISFFSYLFLRTIGISKVSSFICALLFTYSGFILNYSYSFIATYWFIPAIFLFFEKYLKNNKNLIYVLISGLLLGFQILAGSPQISFITLIGIIIYAFFRLFLFDDGKSNNLLKALWYFLKYTVVIIFIGFLIAMVQVIPTFVLSLKSNVANVSKNFVLQGSLKPILLIENFLGFYKNSHIIFGIITSIFLILIGLSFKFKKKYNYNNNIFNSFFYSILIIFFIAFGKYSLFYNYFLIHIPFFDKFPLPSRFMIMGVFFLTILSAISLDIIIKEIQFKNLFLGNIIGIFIVLIVIINIFIMPSQFNIMTSYKNIEKTLRTNHFLLFYKSKNYAGRIYPVSGVFSFRMHLSSSLPPDIWNNSLIAQTPLYYVSLDSITGTKVFVLKDYDRIIDTARGEGLNSGLYRLFNLKYIITAKLIKNNSRKSVSLVNKYHLNKFNFYVYELNKTFRRAFLIKNVKFFKKNSTIFHKMLNSSFNPKYTGYVLGNNNHYIKYQDKSDYCKKKVLIKKWDNNLINIKTDTKNNCFLFISNTFFKGWKAYINGKSKKIYKTDYNFQGVFIKKGNNNVVLKFEPFYFYIGELICIISLGNIILLILYLHIKKTFK